MSNLIDHLEKHLGPIVSGWSQDAAGRKLPFQVVLFEKSPIAGTRVLSTLGMSNKPLRLGESGRQIRQELVVMYRESFGQRNLPGILQQIGLEALQKDKGYLAGEAIGPRGKLIPDSNMEALYVAVPVYFPDDFHVLRPPEGDPIVFGWLVPVTFSEAAFIHNAGWKAFEERLEQLDPDLLDFGRPSIV